MHIIYMYIFLQLHYATTKRTSQWDGIFSGQSRVIGSINEWILAGALF